MPIIEVKNLSRVYEFYRKEEGFLGSVKSFFARKKEFKHAVDDVSFSIEEGELVGFLGPNGAGKTTTLKMLSGILHPTGGSARVLGFTPWQREKEYQKQFALVMGQKNQLILDIPARESFWLHKSIYEIPDGEYKKNLEELVTLLGIGDVLDIPVRKLSLGQKMKCELVAALLHGPKVLFLDEPTIGLDVVAQKNIRDFLKKYNKERKTTIMLTSHYMEDIKELCRRVIIIHSGHAVYDGAFTELVDRFAPYKILRVTFNEPGAGREEMRGFGELAEYNPFACVIKVSRKEARNVAVRLLLGELPVDDILIDEVEADDVVRSIFNAEVRPEKHTRS